MKSPEPERSENYLVYNVAVGWGADLILRQTCRVVGRGQRPLFAKQLAWENI